ncbi:hypothetical protein CLHOM_10970 [Clostridium homopropionicum DSM 5847]|uniref:Phosphate-specific transport system accessory protein PhoU n=1 Tax=Clostridium homopropionicum DSM 5847 TaxID=1121318 RepID=A0A0L6ZBZ8_9CLOT|nr:phosphate signaling complex protein PhoU [Clostridium homopropionicum]KOA20509.1 hypothetical protein CLHOM_10970 [Clostridium homopropionicum DSM 5847]SFG37183.1 phosphate uptake regulator, PhoU [Clostridium homopropionicum]
MSARKVFEMELNELHNHILRMGSVVEKQIHLCIKSLAEQNVELAEEVIKNDDIVDKLMKEIENKSIKLIAMQQPIATDLRFIFTCINLVTDLERMADHAVDIAKITRRLKDEVYIKQLVFIPEMGEIVSAMIRDGLDAYVERDLEKAYEVSRRDDIIDKLYKNIFIEMISVMTKDNTKIEQATQFILAGKFLERIADHVTNICEWTIYIVTGDQIDLNE